MALDFGTSRLVNAALYGSAGNSVEVNVDGSLVVLDKLHAETHNGNTYSVFAFNTAVADTNVLNILLDLTDDIHDIHTTYEVNADAKLRLEFQGNVSYSSGTSVDVINRNRHYSDNPSFITAKKDVTVDTAGELLDKTLAGGGDKQSGAASLNAFEEYVIPAGENCMLQIENQSGADAEVGLTLHFYAVDMS